MRAGGFGNARRIRRLQRRVRSRERSVAARWARQLAPDRRLTFVAVQPDGAHLDEVRYVGDVFTDAEPSWINDFALVGPDTFVVALLRAFAVRPRTTTQLSWVATDAVAHSSHGQRGRTAPPPADLPKAR
jgi:hypothetical protein